jgi:hypothetical protein
MKTKWIEKNYAYNGSQLRSLYAYMNFDLLGDSAIAWRGPCDVTEHMIDGEDKKANAEIRGSDMIHFIIEMFDVTLFGAVAVQRLLASIVKDQLEKLNPSLVGALHRDGDDVYWNTSKKFSISIATQSPTSTLVHFAVNVSNEGTPVATSSLEDFKIEPKLFAQKVLECLSKEHDGIREATRKVFGVK